MSASPQRLENIEIPERPALSSTAPTDAHFRKKVMLWGGLAAAALLALVIIAAVFSGHEQKVARLPAEAPLIKGEQQPIKVSPESPGGMQVPNQEMLVYERMHGSPGAAPPVERLLPEPEQPLAPPQPKSSAPPAEPPALDSGSEPIPAAPASQEAVSPPAAPPAATAPALPEAPAAATSLPELPAPVAPAPKASTAPAPPKPAPPPKAAAPEKPAPKTTAPEKPAAAAKPAKSVGRYQVQLLAGRNAEDVRSAWSKLKAKNTDLLGSLSPTLAPAELSGRGTYYRLRAGPLESEAKARALCDRLSGRGASCIIIRPGS